MEYSAITVEQNESLCILTLNRPPNNTINLALREELNSILFDIEKNNDIRVLVITGAGEKCFSAGMDITDVGNLNRGPDAIEMINHIDRFTKPVIAAINGIALGGGCEMALACHFRFMADMPKAKIGCPEVNLGIIPGWGGVQRLTRLLGRPRALDLILFSRRLSPAEALEIGLVDRVFPAASFMDETMKFARMLAQRPPIAVSCVLKGMIAGMEKGIEEGLRTDRESAEILALSEDAREGFTAFMQKREPVFKGK